MSTVTERPSGPGITPGPEPDPATGGGKKPKKKRHKAPLWTKLVTAFGAVLALVAVGGIVGAKYFLGQLTDNIQTTTGVLGDSATGTNSSSAGTPAGKLPSGAMNLLLLGLDTREEWAAQGIDSRSDTIIIMHIAASHDSAQMISIPRDTKAEIPADPSIGFRGETDKINAAYQVGSANGRGWQGGAKEATAAVHKLTGISFNGVVVIDFDGFKGMLEAMGGVYMCIDKDMWSSHYRVDSKGKVTYAKGADPQSPPSNALWFRKGCRNMQPWEALEYSRLRHSSNGDYDRQRHQQQLLKAMAKKASSSGVLTNPAKVSKILSAAGKSLKMDTHGVSITDFMFGLKGLAGADLVPVKTNSGTFASVDGGTKEGINDVTRQLFAATAADRLDSFLLDHPSLVIDGTTPAK
jgi:LCP family protein required for cell wall assembly